MMLSERIGRVLNALESRWSLLALVQASGLVASFSLPAWAVRSAEIFSQCAPFSWVAAGFLGVLVWAITRWIWQAANTLRVRAKYDAKFMEDGSRLNPLDLTFERKRILLNNFVLPSFALIDGKTFIDCDLIGPANIYFHSSNQAAPIRAPKIDAVWLEPKAVFNNGFIFNNCIFRNCSFQRITMFASVENYDNWKDNPNVNWISIPPSAETLAERQRIIGGDKTAETQATPKPVEDESKVGS
jgi:hypothetical protein